MVFRGNEGGIGHRPKYKERGGGRGEGGGGRGCRKLIAN